ncbi:sce7726 family protein [Virgibacillus sp. YIM 98842]|uniref:sce7726 family protein n=1 Tax=Virgibacillus sp. YIM 98842 TaxID=2663533 RepID=UPI0013DC4FE6|nr:sce7726 family protein [Virgibacillus sp. YIM 98842]
MDVYDKDIRKILIKNFTGIQAYMSDTSTVVVNELDVCFGAARIDLAVVNGQLHGYEIKSEKDTLARLPAQIEIYNKVFDTLTLVVSENHYPRAMKMIPEWWGVLCVRKKEGSLTVETIREASINNKIEPLHLTQFLWKNELLELLEQSNVIKGIKSKTRIQLGRMVTKKVSEEHLFEFVRNKLKTRDDWKALQLPQLCDDLQQS